MKIGLASVALIALARYGAPVSTSSTTESAQHQQAPATTTDGPCCASGTRELETVVVYGSRDGDGDDNTDVDANLDRTASATEVDVETRTDAHASLSDILSEVPGVNVRRTGGVGAASNLVLRGADASHTSVLLGDLPLGSPDEPTIDLGQLPLTLFRQVEVYRGGAPVWLSDGSMGGVLRLIPRQGDASTVTAEIGAGSFGSTWGSAEARIAHDGGGTFIRAGVERSKGDYPYEDDGGTRFVTRDDLTRRRTNAQVESVYGMAHVRFNTRAGQWSFLALGLHREGGEPGPAPLPTTTAERKTSTALGGVAFTRRGRLYDRRYRVQARAGITYATSRFTDTEGELGLGPVDARDDDLSVQGRIAATADATPWLEGTIVLAPRQDIRRPFDHLASEQGPTSTRTSISTSVEARLHGTLAGHRAELRPSVQATWTNAALHADASRLSPSTSPTSSTSPTTMRGWLAPTVRVGALVELTPGLTLITSAATGHRVPTILELFGNRSQLIGNSDLSPERSRTADLGLEFARTFDIVSVFGEARVFGLLLEDLIRYRRTSQFTAVPENVLRARIVGLEAGGRVQLGDHLEIKANATALSTRDDLGRSLPLRPLLVAFVEPALRSGEIVEGTFDELLGFVSIEHTSANFIDPANLVEVPARTWIGTGMRAELFEARASVTLTLHDIFDARGFDVLGFPLPGRRFDTTIAYTETF
ncbi:MAG: TonB-dependent receptor [Deltaproteobacteria bacterium]|nr:TonB-dependent receptor [Deltaproteobacteria bacterium]